MSAAIPSRPPLRPEEGWRPPSRDFFGGPPPVDMTSPANVPNEPVGEVPPEFVFTAGGAIAAPSQARRYASSSQAGLASFAPLLDRIGPGAGAMVEREMDRARAFEVIARAAIAFIDAGVTDDDAERALADAVAENRAAVQ
jgi:hypothetical protein